MENFELGLLLMAVGMTVVFAMLLLVIGFSKGLISLVNRYAPPEEVAVKPTRRPAGAIVSSGDATSALTTAAIVSAVSVITAGQGKVTKIEK
ncbi:MAG: OadG family protein [Tannerella sp.]|jgi:oxaloacetate decarboxylase gamma subunit|nr:OadG family protein [Tannerella sp.]